MQRTSLVNQDVINFCLGLLQLEAEQSIGQERWRFFATFVMSDLLEK